MLLIRRKQTPDRRSFEQTLLILILFIGACSDRTADLIGEEAGITVIEESPDDYIKIEIAFFVKVTQATGIETAFALFVLPD